MISIGLFFMDTIYSSSLSRTRSLLARLAALADTFFGCASTTGAGACCWTTAAGVGAGCWTAATGAGGTLAIFCSPLPAGDPVRESPASGYSAFARLLYRSGMSYSLLV